MVFRGQTIWVQILPLLLILYIIWNKFPNLCFSHFTYLLNGGTYGIYCIVIIRVKLIKPLEEQVLDIY